MIMKRKARVYGYTSTNQGEFVMANVFYVMVYESSFDLSKIEPRTICTNPPCGNVAFTNAGYQRVEVIKQSEEEMKREIQVKIKEQKLKANKKTNG